MDHNCIRYFDRVVEVNWSADSEDAIAFAHSSQLNEATRKVSVEWLKHHYVHRYAIKHNRALESLVTVQRRLRLLHIAHAPNAIMKRSLWIGQWEQKKKKFKLGCRSANDLIILAANSYFRLTNRRKIQINEMHRAEAT